MDIEAEIKNLNSVTFDEPKQRRSFPKRSKKLVGQSYASVVTDFDQTMQTYLKAEGGDEDAALKNTKFAKDLEKAVKGKQGKAWSSP